MLLAVVQQQQQQQQQQLRRGGGGVVARSDAASGGSSTTAAAAAPPPPPTTPTAAPAAAAAPAASTAPVQQQQQQQQQQPAGDAAASAAAAATADAPAAPQAPPSSSAPAAPPPPAASAAAGAAAAAAAAPQTPAAQVTEQERFNRAFAAAFTMSELYASVSGRPEAVPLTEWEARRRRRVLEEILAAAKKRGRDPAAVRGGVEQLEALVGPSFVNLHKLPPASYVALAEDIDGVASRLILLKTLYPTADVFAMVAARPRTLLASGAALTNNAAEVRAMLARGIPDAAAVDAVVQSVPEFAGDGGAAALARSLAFLAAAFKGRDPLEVLRDAGPRVLLNVGESDAEDHAEYGEMTTKD